MTSFLTRYIAFGVPPLGLLLRGGRALQPTTRAVQTATTGAAEPAPTISPTPAPAPAPATTSQRESSPTVPEPAHIKAIVDQISQLKFYEVNLLSDALKRELKIPDLQRVVAAGPVSAEAEEATTASVKSAFTVKLVKFDDSKKVALIKEVKKLVEGINLVEAKRFVEDLPKVIKSNATKDEAEALQKQLEAVGAVVKLD